MKRATLLEQGTGVGTRRTMTVGAATVEERFVVWEPDRRLSLFVIGSSVPGLRVMQEDWRVEETGPGRSRLDLDIGIEGRPTISWLPPLVRMVVSRSTAGAAGIVDHLAHR